MSRCVRDAVLTATWAVDARASSLLPPGNQLSLSLALQVELPCLQRSQVTRREPVLSGPGTRSTAHAGSRHTAPSTMLSNVGR